jgi:hypothetical protein
VRATSAVPDPVKSGDDAIMNVLQGTVQEPAEALHGAVGFILFNSLLIYIRDPDSVPCF